MRVTGRLTRPGRVSRTVVAALAATASFSALPAHALDAPGYEAAVVDQLNDIRQSAGSPLAETGSDQARCYDELTRRWARQMARVDDRIRRGPRAVARACPGDVLDVLLDRTRVRPGRLVARWTEAEPGIRTGGSPHLGVTARRDRDGWWSIAVILGGSAATGPDSPATSADEDRIRAEIVELTNTERRSHGLAALSRDDCLDAVAQRHADHMAATAQFAHQDLGAVFEICGGGLTGLGENIAYNYSPDGATVVAQWMSSPGHRANILRDTFDLIGVGTAQAPDGRVYSVQVFGATR